MVGIFGVIFFVVVVVAYGVWAEHDKAARRSEGRPRRSYGVGIFDADVTSQTYTHKVGDNYYSTTYTHHHDD